MPDIKRQFKKKVLDERLGLGRASKAWLSFIRVVYHSGVKANEDSVAQRAAALSFFTVLYMLPMTVLLLFVLGRSMLFRGQMDRVREMLAQQFVTPAAQPLLEQLFQKLSSHLDFLGAGIMGTLGLGTLLFCGTFLLLTVERNLNELWRSPKLSGAILTRIALLWAGLTLIPLLMAWSVALSARIRGALLLRLPPFIEHYAIPYAITAACFWVLYYWVPKARVRLLPSLCAALSAAFFWEAAKIGMELYVRAVFSQSLLSKVYGSLSLLPIGLAWIYYSWLIFLLGAELSYVLQEFDAMHRSARKRWLHGESYLPLSANAALALLVHLGRHFQSGRGPVLLDSLIYDAHLNPDQVRGWVQSLEGAGIVAYTPHGGVLLAVPPDLIELDRVLKLYADSFLIPLSDAFEGSAGLLSPDLAEVGREVVGKRLDQLLVEKLKSL